MDNLCFYVMSEWFDDFAYGIEFLYSLLKAPVTQALSFPLDIAQALTR